MCSQYFVPILPGGFVPELNYTSLQILTLKKYSSRKVLFIINLHMLNTKFIIYT
jgi:hypothetical protein